MRTIINFRETSLDLNSGTFVRPGLEARLTPLETKILCYFMKRAGFTISRKKLLKYLGWEPTDERGEIDVYIGYLRRKIGREYIETIRGFGYRFIAPLKDIGA